jgi:hypothetical protein
VRAALPTRRLHRLADFRCRRFRHGRRRSLLQLLTITFGATPRIEGQPAEAKGNSDHEHQHKDLICGHTPSFFISFSTWSD